MKVLNYGSLNIDYVYSLKHFVRPGETTSADHYSVYCGGKGLNQSIALARAGLEVYHAGKVGGDGDVLVNKLNDEGVDTSLIKVTSGATGHAIIQVDKKGQNCIILHGGANQQQDIETVQSTMVQFSEGDLCLLQNEVNLIPEIMQEAKKRGLTVAFNPAPMDEKVKGYPLDAVDLFILNEIEAEALTGINVPNDAIQLLIQKYPNSKVIITLGSEGALYGDQSGIYSVAAEKVTAVDTTAAGDTFIGYFLASFSKEKDPQKALVRASQAAAICVTRKGASDSIPKLIEML